MHYHRLHKIGEFGHGKSILLISASQNFSDDLLNYFENYNSKTKKIFCYLLDIENEIIDQKKMQDMGNSTVNTLNKYQYVKDIVVDFPVFLILTIFKHKISILHKNLDSLTVFNPAHKQRYITLFGEEVRIPGFSAFQAENPGISLPTKYANIISLQDPQKALLLASKIKNSKFYANKTYHQAINKVFEII
jgi:hypothetical protein